MRSIRRESSPPLKRIRRRRGADTGIYEARTRDIVVRVSPVYQSEDSAPEEGLWMWGYTVEIENHGAETVQLVARAWTITDGLNRSAEVEGSGVVGEQPELRPREAFRYVSSCPLPTPSGTMVGHFQMMTAAGEVFEAAIPEFSLHLPGAARRVN
ncbi:Co2+/Mg2+ efflux protein ApaG [Caulobacter sp. UNC279MFTsu5.1]|uniref:Co2+/Mg2+ efflux protein ApaG n=1 Tax=Caulobacter sp. UNC279MFTsu5.1 TaxID=1502775 RepID=UPI000364694C|nr:Co2+/Mg2+ efflux protein ApaG [Caulobacter sp. UNC279MFTsu5.1]SFK06159.1 ApaG protein [Caulobacter sp. UNC279MFTsu5.1]